MKWPKDFVNKVINGEALEVLKKMPKESIDMCMTSPPYWGLRDYEVEQIFGGDPGCEHDFNVSHRRRNDKSGGHGNMGYIGAAKSQNGARFGPPTKTCSKCQAWKGQLGLEPTPEFYIEHLTEIFSEVKRALKKEGTLWLNIGDTYGGSCQGGGDTGLSKERHRKELLTYIDKPQRKMMPKCLMMIPERLSWSLIQNGWILRNKIVWYKPNPMPSPVKDRLNNTWEYVFLFSKNKKYYFDLDSIREPHKPKTFTTIGCKYKSRGNNRSRKIKTHNFAISMKERKINPAGVNPGDFWKVATIGFLGVHLSVFPEKLCEKPIKAGCPKDGVLLDPFSGSGTALYVAKQLRRRFIGIDIKKEFCKMSEKRLSQGVLNV